MVSVRALVGKRESRKWRNVSGRRKSKAKVFSSNVVQQKVIQFQLLPRNFRSLSSFGSESLIDFFPAHPPTFQDHEISLLQPWWSFKLVLGRQKNVQMILQRAAERTSSSLMIGIAFEVEIKGWRRTQTSAVGTPLTPSFSNRVCYPCQSLWWLRLTCNKAVGNAASIKQLQPQKTGAKLSAWPHRQDSD